MLANGKMFHQIYYNLQQRRLALVYLHGIAALPTFIQSTHICNHLLDWRAHSLLYHNIKPLRVRLNADKQNGP